MSNVSALRSSLARQGRDFQASMQEQQYSEAHQLRVKEKQMELKAQHLIQSLLNDQVKLHLSYQNGMSEKDSGKVLDNFQLLQDRLQTANMDEQSIASQIERLHTDELQRRDTASMMDRPVLPPRSRAPSTGTAVNRYSFNASMTPSPVSHSHRRRLHLPRVLATVAIGLGQGVTDSLTSVISLL